MSRELVFLHTLLLCLPICLLSQNSSNISSNLIQNGSFEDGVFNFTGGATKVDSISNDSKPESFPGWYITRGNIERWKGLWEPASDCSSISIDLNGLEAATLNTVSFPVTKPNYPHTLLFDTAANPYSFERIINGTFTVSLISAQNSTIISYNVSVTGVEHYEYPDIAIGWRTSALLFITPAALQTNLTLSFSSNIQGIYGPILDNVRIFEGNFSEYAGKDASCKEANPSKKPKIGLILASLIISGSVLVIILCIGVSIWRKIKQRNYIDTKAISILKGKLRVFPYSVLKVATQNFHPDRKLGEGTFGAVYKGTLEDDSEVAIKQLFLKTPQGQDEFWNEVMVISTVQHKNLVSLKGCCARGQERFLVCEYVENKSLYQVLWESKCDHVYLDWPKRFRVALGTARGLAYLHESSQPRIIHRDIKARNILLDKKFEPKIADFGLAKWFPDDKTHVSTHIAGTFGYLAPEYGLRGQLSEKADVFSFGVVVLELVSGRKNLDHSLPLENQYILDWARILWREGKIKDLIDPKMVADMYMEEIERVIRVGLWCTQEVATMRPSMSEAISMLQGLTWQNEKDFTSCEGFDTLYEETPQLSLLLNDSSSSTGFSNKH